MEKGLNASAKNIEPRQPAHSAQADVNRNFSLFLNILHVKRPLYITTLTVVLTKTDYITFHVSSFRNVMGKECVSVEGRGNIYFPIASALRSIKANGRERLQTFANSPSNFDCWRRTFATNRKRILRWYAS